MAAAGYRSAGIASAGRNRASCRHIAITVLTLVAFWLQGYLSLTHMHRTAAPMVGAAVSQVHASAPQKHQPNTIKDDCPLCRYLSGATAPVPPAYIAVVAPVAVGAVLPRIVAVLAAGQIFRHDQWVRGPPR